MTLTRAQAKALNHLRSAFIGPEAGPDEVLQNPPTTQYSVGMLFPTSQGSEPDAQPTQDFQVSDVKSGELEERVAGPPLAEDWRPSSIAISFVVDQECVSCSISGGTYERISNDGPASWQRSQFSFEKLTLTPADSRHQLKAGSVSFEIGSRWRVYGEAHLVTVHVRILSKSCGNVREDIDRMLFQLALSAAPMNDGNILKYDSGKKLDLGREPAELRFRYRNHPVFAVGHGMAADWALSDGRCERVYLDPVPWFVVPGTATTTFKADSPEAEALSLSYLADIDQSSGAVTDSLECFVDAFGRWVAEQEARVSTFGADASIAAGIVARSAETLTRMRSGVELLRDPQGGELRTAFALGMSAMRLQMRQSQLAAGKSKSQIVEPQWRPFQLGFLLVSLASSVDASHVDRELVDLIWFPTGGGKTEAYLGLAAIEIYRRRLSEGMSGGGTAVVTRYTLRLLTAQQFHRAASLVCAMELLRRPGPLSDSRSKGMAPFSIGLWVGNDVTPGSHREARAALDRLLKANRPEEANQFQVESCPWCGTALIPPVRTANQEEYGVCKIGNEIAIHCTNRVCEFRDELPISVVDEALYADPPTILLATVDKFARLQFKPESGRLLGLGTPFAQPSLVIQDELHLLSGPLGTTVAVFDAVIQLLLSRGGTAPKIIASTATIRASDEQVRGLYGRHVALYPPAGVDDDRTFFSEPQKSGEGRLYLGLMPQSISHASAIIAATSPIIEIPAALDKSPPPAPSRDAFWTAVLYHNNLRELGRTGTLVVDDVNARLQVRSERLALPLRTVRADRVVELTSRRGPEDLPKDLRALARRADDSDEAVDVVLSSNMLSVGIDIPRLALMLMVGQPKTTSEYIQATSRVGRGEIQGIIATLFKHNRARDRSHFETFRAYHEALYRSVEPTSVTPWSITSRERSLAGALVALVRHSFKELEANDAASQLNLDDNQVTQRLELLVAEFGALVGRSDAAEKDDTIDELWILLREWDRRASAARSSGGALFYERRRPGDEALLKRFGQSGEGWLVADSMRSVEPNVAIEVREPMEDVAHGAHSA